MTERPPVTTPSAPTWKEHAYTSTACLHWLHDKCRLTCKYCDEPCMCDCHGEQIDKSSVHKIGEQP